MKPSLNQSSSSGTGSRCRAPDLQELSLLYRQTAADLAAIREDRGIRALCALHQPVAGSRPQYHLFRPQGESQGGDFLFYENLSGSIPAPPAPLLLLATAIFAVAGLVGAVLTYQNPDFKVKLLGPQEMVETIERHQMWTHSIVGIKPVASSAIMTNNMSVGFTTFALGITAGLGTIYMMAFNGLT